LYGLTPIVGGAIALKMTPGAKCHACASWCLAFQGMELETRCLRYSDFDAHPTERCNARQ
jgi:hypothetical protein